MTAPENEVHIIDKNTFKVTPTQHGPHTVVGLQGDFDVYSAPTLREVLWPLAANARGNLIVVVDSQRRAMEFFDSTCLGVLIGALRRSRHRGTASMWSTLLTGCSAKSFASPASRASCPCTSI